MATVTGLSIPFPFAGTAGSGDLLLSPRLPMLRFCYDFMADMEVLLLALGFYIGEDVF